MELLERSRIIRVIESALGSAACGSGGALFIVGEAGLGKSAVIAEALARSDGFLVRSACCSELDIGLPFGLLDQLFEGWGVPGTAMSGRPYDAENARVDRYLSLLEWLRNRPSESALLLAIDDLHWADPDSIEILVLVCRKLGSLPVAMIATLRPRPSVALERALALHQVGADLEHLQPLSAEASGTFFREIAGGLVAQDVVDKAHSACAGNPLLIGEVARAWKEGSDLLGPASATIAERAFLPRFAGVGPASFNWARCASVLGTRFAPSMVASIVEQSAGESRGALDDLCAAGLIREGPRGLAEFVHPLIREALYDDLSVAAKNHFHVRAFDLLIERKASPVEAAAHALVASTEGDRRAVDILARAGRIALASGAISSASTHLSNALAASGDDPAPDLRRDLAHAWFLRSDIPNAEHQIRRALEAGSMTDADRVDSYRLLSQILLATARFDESMEYVYLASDLASGFDARLAIEMLLDATFAGWLLVGPLRASVGVAKATAMIETIPAADPELRRSVTTAEGYLALLNGDHSGVDCLDEAFHAAMSKPTLRVYPSPYRWDPVFGYTIMAKHLERYEDHKIGYQRLTEAARLQGASLSEQAYYISDADGLWRLGRLDEAMALLTAATELFELAPGIAPFCMVGLAHIDNEMGRESESRHWSDLLESLMPLLGDPPYLRMWLLILSSRRAIESGDLTTAAKDASLLEELARSSGIVEPCLVPWHATAIDAHLRAGDLTRAEQVVYSLDEVCEPLPCRAPRSVAATGRANIARRKGEPELAERTFEQALELVSDLPMPLTVAETMLSYGRFLRSTGQSRQARLTFNRALDTLDGTGAARLQRLAREELGTSGGRRRKPSTALTDQEARVALLAAEGLTNKQIAGKLSISAKTIDHHLSRSYAKLGIASRRDLMKMDPGQIG